MSRPPIRSLAIVVDEVRADRQMQLTHFDSLVRPFRDKYLAAEPEFTTVRLLDTQIDMIERMGRILQSKAVRLKLSMVALAGAVLFVGVGLGLD